MEAMADARVYAIPPGNLIMLIQKGMCKRQLKILGVILRMRAILVNPMIQTSLYQMKEIPSLANDYVYASRGISKITVSACISRVVSVHQAIPLII